MTMEKLPKSIADERRDPAWRVTQDAAAHQWFLQPLNPRAEPRIGLLPHAARARWDGIEHRTRAPEPLPEPVGLQIGTRLRASALAFVNRAPAAGPAAIACQPPEQSRHASLAIRTMQPGSGTAEVASRPRHLDTLRSRPVTQLKENPISSRTHCHNAGPSQRRLKGDPAAP